MTSDSSIRIIPFSSLTTGEMILSGGKDGIVAVSSPRTGMTIRILADHKGSAITVLQCIRKQVRPACVSQHRVGVRSLHCGREQQPGWVSCPALLFRPSTSSNFCWLFFFFPGIVLVEKSHCIALRLPERVGRHSVHALWALQEQHPLRAAWVGPCPH